MAGYHSTSQSKFLVYVFFLLTCNSTFIDYTKCTEKSNKFQTYQHQTYLYYVPSCDPAVVA